MKRIILSLLAIAISLDIFASAFYIDRYNISIRISEDDIYHIEEGLNVVFTSPSHGIYRDIQYLYDNPLNSWKSIRANIQNIECNLPYSIESSNGFISLKIGDSNKILSGAEEIYIAYDYDLGGDIYPDDYDEFYYNIISAAWDCPIFNISYRLEFPHRIDSNRIWITYGQYGSATLSKFNLDDTSTTITGSFDKLNPYNAITARVEMENGYFSRQAKDIEESIDIALIAVSILAIIFTVYTFISYKYYGVDNSLTPPIVFYPPDEFDPLDVSYIYDRNKDKDRCITAMFFYFADKGYIKIEEENDKFTFIKAKELPADEGKAEKLLFSLLFNAKDRVSFKDLERSNFYEKAQGIFPLVEKQFRGEQSLFDSTSIKKKKLNTSLLIVLSILVGIAISAPAVGILTLLMIVVNTGAAIALLSLTSAIVDKRHTMSRGKSIGSFIPIIIVFLVFSYIMISINRTLTQNTISLLEPIFVMTSYLISAISIAATTRRSSFGEKVLEECLGYKDFIERVEIERLKLLINDNPSIFYNTLSYAIVFNLEDCWARKFKDLYIPKCSWYYSPERDVLDAMFFSSIIRKTRRLYTGLQPKIEHNGPISGGGGSRTFSGSSGFSGGGFSGGGGRSW